MAQPGTRSYNFLHSSMPLYQRSTKHSTSNVGQLIHVVSVAHQPKQFCFVFIAKKKKNNVLRIRKKTFYLQFGIKKKSPIFLWVPQENIDPVILRAQ
jgi:hypothetical protein